MASSSISTAQRLDAEREMDHITAGPRELGRTLYFELNCNALHALTTLDQMCGKTTEEEGVPTYGYFEAERCVETDGRRMCFTFAHGRNRTGEVWDNVSIRGLKVSNLLTGSTRFPKSTGYLSYLRLLENVIAVVPNKICALAMGQHARLGSESLLFQLPADLFQRMFQIRDDVRIETWDSEKQKAYAFRIRHPNFEVTEGLIRKLVAAAPYRTTGEEDAIQVKTLEFKIMYGEGACARMDDKFDWITEEEGDLRDRFDAVRKITIGDFTVTIEFRSTGPDGSGGTRVTGFREAAELSCSGDLCSEAFDYLVTTLLDNRPRHLAARLTDGNDRVLGIV